MVLLVFAQGRVVVVRVKDGTEYTGNLYTVEPGQNGGLMVVLKFARLKVWAAFQHMLACLRATRVAAVCCRNLAQLVLLQAN